MYKKTDEITCFHWNPIGVDELPGDEYTPHVVQI